MWREEIGITEMMLAYIGEFAEFQGWSSWRKIVIDILTCHEEVRHQRIAQLDGVVINEDMRKQFVNMGMVEDNAASSPMENHDQVAERSNQLDAYQMYTGVSKDQKAQRIKDADNVLQSSSNVASNIKEDDSDFIHINEVKEENADMKEVALEGEEIVEQELSMESEIINEEFFKIGDLYQKPPQMAYRNVHNDPCLQDFRLSESTGECSSKATIQRNPPMNETPIFISQTPERSSSTGNACSFCGKQFSRYSEKRRHERIHTGEKPYSCSYCGRSFTQINHKRSHELIHRREKPYECSYCDRSFARNEDKQAHERNHTGERPYTCSYCNKGLSSLRQKRSHERIHTDEKTNACRFCGKTFRQLSRLLAHERIHSNEPNFEFT